MIHIENIFQQRLLPLLLYCAHQSPGVLCILGKLFIFLTFYALFGLCPENPRKLTFVGPILKQILKTKILGSQATSAPRKNKSYPLFPNKLLHFSPQHIFRFPSLEKRKKIELQCFPVALSSLSTNYVTGWRGDTFPLWNFKATD